MRIHNSRCQLQLWNDKRKNSHSNGLGQPITIGSSSPFSDESIAFERKLLRWIELHRCDGVTQFHHCRLRASRLDRLFGIGLESVQFNDV